MWAQVAAESGGILNSSYLLSPLAEAGPAECLGQEMGALPLQELGRERVHRGCEPNAVRAPSPDHRGQLWCEGL